MLASILGLSQEKLECTNLAISMRQVALDTTSGLQESNAALNDSTPTFPISTSVPCQSVGTHMGIPQINEHIGAGLDNFEDLDHLNKSREVDGKNNDVNDILSRISLLEKNQGDVLTVLRSMNERLLATSTTPPEMAYK